MATLIPTTSAWKKAVRKGRRERERSKVRASSTSPPHDPSTLPFADIAFYRSPFSALRTPTAVLRRHSRRAQYRHSAPPAPPGASEDGRCAMSGVNEGAERAHTCDWPARRCSSAATVYSA
jgi:hypothetical protein